MAVRTAAAATQIIGVIWAVLALIYHTDTHTTITDFGVGIAVTATGFAIWMLAGWMQTRGDEPGNEETQP